MEKQRQKQDESPSTRAQDHSGDLGTFDVLILGGGIGGLSTALKFARVPNLRVLLVTKDQLDEGATRYAQGGIASVWSKTDSFASHIRDTLEAGAGLCRQESVEICVKEGPAGVQELIEYGVPFTRAEGGDPAEVFDLHREGGHTERRILHADDLTGLAIERTLIERVRASPAIRVLEHHVAIDLVTEGKLLKSFRKPGRVMGAYLLEESTGTVWSAAAGITVLATGGAGKVYLYTSNPDVATGDGIAMAYRAGARVANLEFMQFHPTCLYHPEAKNFLITEALRGEGAVLVNRAGEKFMDRYDPRGSLAPRDIVARAIDLEMKRTGDVSVFLDARALGEDLAKKFPNILERCQAFGINPYETPIPVVPAAHYMCGGVWVDAHGATTLPGLYAVGEVACTGLHGANRLASNSLLEAVVFSERVFRAGMGQLARVAETLGAPSTFAAPHSLPMPTLPQWDFGRAVRLEEQLDIAALWHEVRTLMWNYVGIVRSDRRLESARRRLERIQDEVQHFYWNYFLTQDLVELRNLVTTAQLIVECASMRKESRGLHYTVDFPERSPSFEGRDTLL